MNYEIIPLESVKVFDNGPESLGRFNITHTQEPNPQVIKTNIGKEVIDYCIDENEAKKILENSQKPVMAVNSDCRWVVVFPDPQDPAKKIAVLCGEAITVPPHYWGASEQRKIDANKYLGRTLYDKARTEGAEAAMELISSANTKRETSRETARMR